MGQGNSSHTTKDEAASELQQSFDRLKDVESGLSKARFIQVLSLPLPEECAFHGDRSAIATRWLSLHEDTQHEEVLSFDHFSLLVHDIKTQTAAEFMFSLFAGDNGQITEKDAIEIYNSARLLFLSRLHEGCAVDVLNDIAPAEALGKGLFSHKENMDIDTFVRWSSANTGRAFDSIYAWIMSQIEEVDESDASKERHGLTLVKGDGSDEAKMTINTAWMISASVPAVFSTSHSWSLLFNSNNDGLSSSQFMHRIAKYTGPLLLSFVLDDGQHYVVALDEPIRDHQTEFGGYQCRIVRMSPVFLTYDNVKAYVNLKQRHAQHGLGFGSDPKTAETAKLWVSASFDEVTTKLTHNHAGVAHTGKLHMLEVWGCGNNDEVLKMKERQKRDLLAAQQRQTAQRPSANEWHDSPDRQILKMAGTLTIDEESRVSTKRDED